MIRQKLWIGLVVLFLAGVLTGVVGAALYWQYKHDHQGERGPAARQERRIVCKSFDPVPAPTING